MQNAAIKIGLSIAGGLLAILIVTAFREGHQRRVLAAAIDNHVRALLPALSPMSDLGENVPLGRNAVWWISDGVQYAGGGVDRSTGLISPALPFMVSGVGPLGVLTPSFEELDTVVIVKETLAEEKRYLVLPKEIWLNAMKQPEALVLNPFCLSLSQVLVVDRYGRGYMDADRYGRVCGPPQLIDNSGQCHSANEFTQDRKTYSLQVWVVDTKTNQIVGYHFFPASVLPETDVVPLSALVDWIKSLEKLRKKPAVTSKSSGHNRLIAPSVQGKILRTT